MTIWPNAHIKHWSGSEVDAAALTSVCKAAFSPEEGQSIADLVNALVTSASSPATHTFVVDGAGIDGTGIEGADQNVAFAIFSPVYLDTAPDHSLYILAPLAVHPTYQRQGLGYSLVASGLEILKQQNVEYVLVYGDPKYYDRFGFSAAHAKPFLPPFPLSYPFGWQAVQLSKSQSLAQSQGLKTPHKIRCVPALSKADYW